MNGKMITIIMFHFKKMIKINKNKKNRRLSLKESKIIFLVKKN